MEQLSIKLNRSDSDHWEAGHFELFKAQDHPFNEKHFCGYFMAALELFFSNGICECIFIMDNSLFNRTSFLGYIGNNSLVNTRCLAIVENVRVYTVSTILECFGKKGQSIAYLLPYSPILEPIEYVFSKWNGYVMSHGYSTP
ncbi:hypothetical protein RF11_09439 [Thelohanellus kitauei]|uniref:Tc1-like transposase DDE domain-containing protein n=1 Tax=Thelohanellus kitauei TaxID=669202 RepID=A0A0C2J6K2_THEKT|nr:hypothetical protein RF11_09439 [Thelohanellus kitauei]